MPKKKILILIGTRPEAIKLAPVVKALRESGSCAPRVCLTGQHAAIVEAMLKHFGVRIACRLPVLRANEGLTGLLGEAASALAKEISMSRPDGIVVQGDTTSAMLGGISGFYEGVPVFHVEAGLRSFNMLQPFPEEFNRRVISLAASMHFCPTSVSRKNLADEGVPSKRIQVVGNTCIDAILWTLSHGREGRRIFSPGKRGILVTGHRRENWAEGLDTMCQALSAIAASDSNVQIIYAVHPNPLVKNIAERNLLHNPNIKLIPPLGYAQFCRAMREATLIISDSGGVQEEALALGTPVLVTRDVTERPEVLKWPTVRLVGTDKRVIVQAARDLLENPGKLSVARRPHFPFGRGNASSKIAKGIARFFDRQS